ncbi:MAG: polysaccharide export protein [Ponticaulis sp.]|nr:polysaccharide export protein [Ponticaulis sp.]|tara:strand:- start:31603 stop:32310 length:708 start_codon:yes stop_codon:yes gene_type:complete
MKTRAILLLGGILAACTSHPNPTIPANGVQGFQPYSPSLPNYRVYPGDQLRVTIYSAPELSQENLIVGPDGRIQLPLLEPIMVADRTIPEINTLLKNAMATRLVDPSLDAVVTMFGPQTVFVGGEVGQPGIIEMPGQVDALQAIIMAGGFTDRARERQVILVRRDPDGTVNSYSLDVRSGWNDPQIANLGPLQRFDVIYVPKTRIAQHNLFMQQYIRDALPVSFSFVYDLARTNQ